MSKSRSSNVLFAPIHPSRVKQLRKESGMNQHDFWSKVGVTQSGGSRYESGRAMPNPVLAMMRITHIWHLPPTVLYYVSQKTKGAAEAGMAAGKATLKLIRGNVSSSRLKFLNSLPKFKPFKRTAYITGEVGSLRVNVKTK